MEGYHSRQFASRETHALHQTAVIVHVNEAGGRVPSCQIGSRQTCPEQGWVLGIERPRCAGARDRDRTATPAQGQQCGEPAGAAAFTGTL